MNIHVKNSQIRGHFAEFDLDWHPFLPLLTSSNPWGKIYMAYHVLGYAMCMYAKNCILWCIFQFGPDWPLFWPRLTSNI